MRPGNRYIGSAIDPDHGPTLGELIQQRSRVTASCNQCRHVAHVDPAPLAERLGYDYLVESLFTRFKCTTCGSKRVDVSISGSG
jgi:Zn finger protein HypA/HybF involved in hydrogenase expression